MKKCNAMNVKLMLNLSPNKDGRIDDNLATAFRRLGEVQEMPEPLQNLPTGWLHRKK